MVDWVTNLYWLSDEEWTPQDYPHATAYGRETVSLPLAPKLNDGDVKRVIGAVRKILLGPTAR